MSAMDKLTKGRRPVRAQVTQTSNAISAILVKDVVTEEDLKTLRVKYELLQVKWKSLEQWDEKVKLQLIEDAATEAAEDAEHQEIEKYEEQYFTLMKQYEDFFSSAKPGSTTEEIVSTASAGEKKRKYHLPEVKLRSFGGQLEDWLGWWSQFRQIHEDEELHNTDKFQYLVQSMEAGSEARKLVDSYPMTGANYKVAVEALKERFGRHDLLLQVYIRKLLTLVIGNVTSDKKMPLSQLYLSLESHLRSLSELQLDKADPATWLYPLVESSLYEETLKAWQRSTYSRLDGTQMDPPKSRLDLLMDFIKTEVKSDQQIELARQGFQPKENVTVVERKRFPARKTEWRSRKPEKVPTAASLVIGQSQAFCSLCNGNHPPYKCQLLKKLSHEQLWKLTRDKNLCFKCFTVGHRRIECRRRLTCRGCGGDHYDVMCKNDKNSTTSNERPLGGKRSADTKADVSQNKKVRFIGNSENGDLQIVTQNNNQCSPRVLLNTVKVKAEVSPGKFVILRLVGDSCSQRSFATCEALGNLMGDNVGDEWLQTIVFGGTKTTPKRYAKKRVKLVGMNGAEMTLDLLEKDRITGEIREIPFGPWLEECDKRGINLSDVGDGWSEADILIGNDYWGALRTGNLVQLDCGLTAEETIFGWTLGGPISAESVIASAMSVVKAPPQSIEKLWTFETLGIRDPAEALSRKEAEKMALEHFQDTVKRAEDGSYIVSLPWRASKAVLPSNRKIAEMRLKSTTHKLCASQKLSQYHAVLQSWETEGLIRRVNSSDNSGHFIPHRPVFKDSETTPVRPVFDASCRQGRLPSLNDCLYKGPNLIELIPVMLLRFGDKRMGVSADIRKAFQMLRINEEDKKYQRFLWWENERCEKMIVYEHQRVVFGVTSSPFLLGATIQHHLGVYDGSVTALELKKSFYVDNLVTSVASVNDFLKLRAEADEVMGSAKMELRQWACSELEPGQKALSEEKEVVPILGLVWNRKKDWLSCVLKKTVVETPVTKRLMLSVIAQIFDPMGYLAPTLLVPKVMVQSTWNHRCGWDEPVPKEVEKRFCQWMSQLEIVERVKLPRWNKVDDPEKTEVHIFCDSSTVGMAAVGFLKTWSKTGVKLQFLLCKARLTPMKKTTIPRLELVGCVLGVRISRVIMEALTLPKEAFTFWSDSSTALTWIRKAGDWGVFVGNRVKEILCHSNASQWKHVPGVCNPADLPSRGCSPEKLVQSAWWEGPQWLLDEEFPAFEEKINHQEVASELRNGQVFTMSQQLNNVEPPRFSSYRKNVAVWGWILRFWRNCRDGRVTRCLGNTIDVPKLTVEELREAEVILLRNIQMASFPENCREIGGLDIVRGEKGLLRVKTRLVNRSDKSDFIYPVVLPKNHPMVDLLVLDLHRKHGHGGVQFLLSKLREKYWILQSRRTVRRVIRKCVQCKRHTTKPMEVDPAPLPSRRVDNAEVFQTTGVDLAGPLYLKTGEKVWIVIFTCALYRAIHLDLVRSLSSEDFVLALERFVALQGRPNTLYSDNGTNFVGVAKLFSRTDWTKISDECNINQILWIFNPPTAAWWGGFWERMVRSVKELLRRMLGKARLSFDEMRTCLAGVSSTINDRPLTVVTEDDMDLIPLTPSMFMRPRANAHFPDLESAVGMRKSYKKMKEIQRALEERFRKEYLALLVTRCGKGKQSEINVGDVVLVGSDNRKRYEWPLGVVTKLFPGKDEKNRVVQVKTSGGTFTRPLQRLFPLEISSKKDEAMEAVARSTRSDFVKTRAGREVRKPARYGQWIHLVVDC